MTEQEIIIANEILVKNINYFKASEKKRRKLIRTIKDFLEDGNVGFHDDTDIDTITGQTLLTLYKGTFDTAVRNINNGKINI